MKIKLEVVAGEHGLHKIVLTDSNNHKIPFLFTSEDIVILMDALGRPGTWEQFFKSLLEFLRPATPDPTRIDVC